MKPGVFQQGRSRGCAALWVARILVCGALLGVGWGPGHHAVAAEGVAGEAAMEAQPVTSVPGAPSVPDAGTPADAFDAAAKLYEQGRPADAAAAYERLLNRGATTPAVYFNQGNAWLQAGRIGRAIASYRRALQLAPRDAEISANLAGARAKVASSVALREGLGTRALRVLRPNEWAGLALVSMWLWLGWLVLREAVPRLRQAAVGLGAGLAVGAVVSGAVAWAARNQAAQPWAVVIGTDTAARFGPLEESQVAFTLPDGAELRISDRKGDWIEVRDAAGRRGWVLARNIVPVP